MAQKDTDKDIGSENTGFRTPSACSTHWSYIKGLLSLCTGLDFFSAVGPSAIGKQLKEKKSWTQLEGLAT